MLRADWSQKPNAKVWEQLVFDSWWTNVAAVTDADGELIERIFRGTHELTVSVDGKTISKSFSVSDKPLKITVRLN